MVSRRSVLGGAAGSAVLGGLRPALAAGGYRMPAEWHPHALCVMAFSAAFGAYSRADVHAIRREQAAIAQAIARFEPVTMLANAEDVPTAQALCGPEVSVSALAHYDVWTRDTLPSFVIDDVGTLAAVSWNFNVWGEKYPEYPGYDADRDLAERMAAMLGIPLTKARIVAEGGAIETDGAGTLLTTETCLLNPNRNPGLTKAEIDAELGRLTGARKIIWAYGSEADTVTDGHIDGIARFVAPGVAMVEISDDPADPEHRDLLENARILESATDADGQSIEVVRMLRPRWEEMPERGDDFAASYVNAYVANSGIVMPRFGDRARDGAARQIFADLHPGHEIVQIPVDTICEGGGGIHCNTQQIPRV